MYEGTKPCAYIMNMHASFALGCELVLQLVKSNTTANLRGLFICKACKATLNFAKSVVPVLPCEAARLVLFLEVSHVLLTKTVKQIPIKHVLAKVTSKQMTALPSSTSLPLLTLHRSVSTLGKKGHLSMSCFLISPPVPPINIY